MQKVFTKARKNYPAVETHYSADLVKGKSITVRDDRTGALNAFKLGDMAEYDSYNLSYYGPIIAITDKRVTIICRHDVRQHEAGEKVKKHSLDLNTFCWRNHNFNLNETIDDNMRTSYTI